MPNDTEDKAGEEELTEEGIGLEIARSTLGDLVLRAGFGNERIVLTRKGKQIAALVGMKDVERLRSMDESAQPLARVGS